MIKQTNTYLALGGGHLGMNKFVLIPGYMSFGFPGFQNPMSIPSSNKMVQLGCQTFPEGHLHLISLEFPYKAILIYLGWNH